MWKFLLRRKSKVFEAACIESNLLYSSVDA